MKKLIIAARLNEYEMRAANPNVPWSAAELVRDAVACREAGASIVHFHARDGVTGGPDHATETYAGILRGIHDACDVLIEPPLGTLNADPPASRADQIAVLAADPRTRPDIAAIDMASVNLDLYDAARRVFRNDGLVFANPTDLLRAFTATVRGAGVKTVHVCWNVGSLRLVEAFVDMGLVGAPAFLALRLSDGGLLAGHPPTPRGLQAYLDFLPCSGPVEWMAVASPGNIAHTAAMAIGLGGHIGVGLGDHSQPGLARRGEPPTNADVVRHFAALARSMGREVATPEEARAILGMD